VFKERHATVSREDLEEMGMFSGETVDEDDRDRGLYADMLHWASDITLSQYLEEIIPVSFDGLGGSNGWVISGEHTESGKPILASDPHMPNMLPVFWWQAQMTARDGSYNAIGASSTGAPGIQLGATDHAAWAITSARTDLADFYLEKINDD